MRGVLVGMLIVFGFGTLMGNKMATPEVDIVKIKGPTRIVTKTETKTVYRLPEACVMAMDAAHDLWEYGANLYENGPRQNRIISKSRLYLGQGKDMDDVDREQRDLSGDQVGDLEEMARAMSQFRKADEECEEQK